MRGPVRNTFRTALEARAQATDEQTTTRAWKLLLLVSRMLLFRRLGETTIEKDVLRARLEAFRESRWLDLLAASEESATSSADGARQSSRSQPDLERRAERAAALVHLGEVSAARQALVAEPLAPGSAETLSELRDPLRRPQQPYGPLGDELSSFQPQTPFALDHSRFLQGLGRARRGAAAGPSGATAEHLQALIDDKDCSSLLCDATEQLARGEVPAEIAAGIRLGRLTALRKANGRVRGIVTGDVLRRAVAVASLSSWPLILKPVAPPSNLPCPQERGLSASCTLCKLLRNSIPGPPSFPLMALALSIMHPGSPCC